MIDGVNSGATSILSLNGAGGIEFTKNNTYTGLTNHHGNSGFGALQTQYARWTRRERGWQ